MKHYRLTITSKNKKSLKNFFKFLHKNFKTKFNIVSKYSSKTNEKTFLTILKSPHVNKTAQEQFESKYFSKQINVYAPKNFKMLLFLKKIKINLFPDINIETKFVLNKNLLSKIKTDAFNPQNFKLNSFKNNTISNNKKQFCKLNKNKSFKNLTCYIYILDFYGKSVNILFR